MSEATVTSIGMPGWYGKLPSLGDFATRRLPEEFVQHWDSWLQRSLASARAELGEQWLDAYLVAPVRRFWLGPGVVGAASWAGVIMPSVDRVGRHFPLTIAQPLESLVAALAARDWYRAIDEAARRVLDIHATVDDLESDIATLPAPHDAPVSDAAHRLADAVIGTPGSVWWCNDAIDPAQLLCFPELPPEHAFVSLLGGPP